MPDPNDKVTVEIEETVDTPEEEIVIETKDLHPEEVKMAKERGIIKEPKEEKKDEHKEQPKPSTEENKSKEEVPTFEEVEKDENQLKKYNKNEQALYWKWKTDRHKRQAAQKEKETIQSEYELDKVKHISTKQKLDKLKSELTAGKEITAEDLLKIINDGEKEETEGAPKKQDPTETIREKISVKAQYAEKIGEAQYENFQEIAKLAKEIIENDKSKTYQKLIDQSFIDDSVDENMLVERIVSIAKLSDKYSKIGKSAPDDKKEEAERIIKNSEKKTSSAAISKSGGKRTITEDELTVSEAAKLSTEQWGRLSDKTRKRILMGIDP